VGIPYMPAVSSFSLKRLVQLVTENKAVEGEKLHGVGHYSGLKDDTKENIVVTYQGALLPRCVGHHLKDH
jgi:hypothetical protein